MTAVLSSRVAAAWQAALAAEYAAVFGYALLGPHLAAAAQTSLARSSQNQHAAITVTTSTALISAGQPDVPPLPDYPWMYPVTDELSAQRLAIRLEVNTTSAWRYLIAAAAAPQEAGSGLATVRANALASLSAAAVRAMRWRIIVNPALPTVPFPGI
jgi:Domain of unknown function (DUF4439)